MTIFGTVTGKTEIKNGWEFELNIKLNFFIISTLESQSDENCTYFLLFVRSPVMILENKFYNLLSSNLVNSQFSLRVKTSNEFPSKFFFLKHFILQLNFEWIRWKKSAVHGEVKWTEKTQNIHTENNFMDIWTSVHNFIRLTLD